MVPVQGTLHFKNNLDIHKEWLLKNEGNVPKPLKRISVNRPKSPVAKRRVPTGGVEDGIENQAARSAVKTSSPKLTAADGLQSTRTQTKTQTQTASKNMKPIGGAQEATRSATLMSSAGSATSSDTHATAQRPNMAAPVAKKTPSQTTRVLPDELSELSDFDLSSDDLPTPIARKATRATTTATIPCTMPSILATPKTTRLSPIPTHSELMELLGLYRKLRHKPNDTLLLAQIDELEAALKPDTSAFNRDTCTEVLDTPARPESRDDSPQVVSDSEPEDELLELPKKYASKDKEEAPSQKKLSDFDMDDIDLDLELELDMAKKDSDNDSMPFSDALEDFQKPLAPPSITPRKPRGQSHHESEPIEIDSDDFESDFSVMQVSGPNGAEKDPDSSALNPFGPGRTLFPSSSPTRFNVADDDDDDDDIDMALNNVGNRREVGASTQGILDLGIDDGDDIGLSDASEECVAIEADEYPWTQEVYKVLRQRFMLNEFRANQLHAINATLNGDDVLVLMPTGGGKSLCYQLPALVNGGKTRGLSVVISPLISLMKDQTEALMAKNISCAMFNSSQSAAERKLSLSALSGGDIALLYVSPEMFQQSSVMQSNLQKLHEQNRLARIVIDEAHCVSSWGHDFRPDYKALVNVKSRFPGVPIMALTATANEKVRMDIQGCLRPNRRFFKQSFNRPNLYYEVRLKTKTFQQEIEDLLRGRFRGQTGIIYCHSKQLCETTSEFLQAAGIKADFYHAGMETEQRTHVQGKWQSGKIQVVCATIAFGMGIDKPDVRYVIHCTVPRNMEGYYQETGRAGRDGLPSTCIVYFNQKDARQMLFHIAKDEFLGENGKVDWQLTQRQRTHHRELMQGVINYCENRVDCRRVQVLRYFNETFDPKLCRNSCDNCRYGHEYTQETRDVSDVSKNIIKLISAATQESQNITVAHCCDLIRGSATKKIKDMGHNLLAGYGMGKHYDKTTLERIVTKLILMKALRAHTERNKSGFANTYLRPDSLWRDVLQGNEQVTIVTHVHDTGSKSASLNRTNGRPAGEPMGFETASSYARRTNSLDLLTPSGAYAVPDPKPTSRSRAALLSNSVTSSIKNRVTKTSTPTTAKKPVSRTLTGASLQRTPSRSTPKAKTTATINLTSDSSQGTSSKPAKKSATTATRATPTTKATPTAKATPATNTKSTSSFFDRPMSEALLTQRHQSEAYKRLEEVRSDYCNEHNLTRPSSVCSEDVLEVLSCELPTNFGEFSALLPDHKQLFVVFARHLRSLHAERESLKATKGVSSKGGASLKEKFAFKAS
ncbi:ATP-dependent DNA helicase hus2/rqh1 [Yarrowia sp. B02]|nr:ATP-dependent DNA helicase hus2/rqh1 [Yarrowia sp. B02]